MKNLLSPPAHSPRASAGLLALRLFCGYAFMMHGWDKIRHPFDWMGPDSGYPGVFQALAALSEFGGGLAWILGLLTPVASFGMACTMLVAARVHLLVLHQPLIPNKDSKGSAELPVLYLCVALLLLLAGPGRFSLDARLFREKS